MNFANRLRASAFTLTTVFALGAFVTSTHAAAPQTKTNAPGFYRVMLGDFEVTALLDGTVELPV